MLQSGKEKYSLLVHDINYSKNDLILNPDLLKGTVLKVGDLIQIQTHDTKKILFKISNINENSSIQISIAQNIALLFDITPRSLVEVKKITDIESVSCSTIEISFRDQYIGRSDMWQLKMSLVNTAVYVGKKISNLGVRGQVKAIYVNGVPKSCGYVQEDTRCIFRSETAKFFIFIQMSKEMWEFAEDGEMYLEKCVFGFLPELFAKWKESGANHVVSIVLFARVVYPHAVVLNSLHNRSEDEIHFHTDVQNRPCRDFYKVTIDWESKSDWNSILVHLKKQIILFQKEILQQTDAAGSTVLLGSNSTAKQGNILEAINLALNPFDKHYIDRDLSRTGLSIVVISPSTGIFEVEKKLCRVTVQRMIDSGISLDLVCLSPPPLHAVPLFQFQSQEMPSTYSHEYTNHASQANQTVSSGFSGEINHQTLNGTTFSSKGFQSVSGKVDALDHLYIDDQFLQYGTNVDVFMIPDWIDISFWNRQTSQSLQIHVGQSTDGFEETEKFMTRCKMYEVQMGIIEIGTMDMEIPDLDIFDDNLSPSLLQIPQSDMAIPHSVHGSLSIAIPSQSQDLTRICDQYDQSVFKSSKCGISTLNLGTQISGILSSRNDRNVAPSASSGRSWGKMTEREEGKSPETKLVNENTVTIASSLGDKFRRMKVIGDEEGETEKFHEYLSSIEPIRIRKKSREYDYVHISRSSLSNESPTRDFRESPQRGIGTTFMKFSPSKTPATNVQLLRHKYINPFQPIGATQVGSSDRRWEHIFPKWISHDEETLYTNWKSLCSPACLPLTIEYFPTADELSEFYLEYTYTVSPAFDEFVGIRDEKGENRKIEALLIELISQRLAQGFQLIVSPHNSLDLKPSTVNSARLSKKPTIVKSFSVGVDTNSSSDTIDRQIFSISKPYFLSLGDHVHRLFYDASGNNVEVKRYTRRVTYNTDPISYTCNVWARHMTKYIQKSVTFSYPALSSYNWNYLDHLISGYQDQMTDALRFWRIRFLLIPLETPPNIFSSVSVDSDRLDDEEERIVGFLKFMDMIEKARFIPPDERKKKKVKKSFDIQLTTLNLSSLVVSEDVHSLLPEAFLTPRLENEIAVSTSEPLSKNSSLDVIGNAMLRPPPFGVVFQDRHWHFKVYESVITGEEFINWVIQQFQDVENRESAIEIGNLLIEGGILEHVKQTHKLLDGFYFYRLCNDWAQSNKFFRDGDHTGNHSFFFSRKRFQSVKQVTLDLDPFKKSSRQELAMLHYDTTHNTKNCYHFQLHWLVCTARLIEDMLHSWARMADKCGFKLVEASGDQADDNPFQTVVPIELAVPPPFEFLNEIKCHQTVKIPREFFERELVSSFNFVLDTESDSCFPPNSRGFSYQRKDMLHTQYVHRSGAAFVQILPNSQGFLWVNNRLLLASTSASSKVGGHGLVSSGNTVIPSTANPNIQSINLHPDQLREKFTSFCADKELLTQFYANIQEQLERRIKRDVVNFQDPEKIMIIDSLF